MSKNTTQAAALRAFADSLRLRGGIGHSTAKLALRAGHEEVYEWRDYVRAKDLLKHLKGQQQLLDEHTKPQAAGRDQQAQIEDLLLLLTSKHRLLLPAERRFKKAKPGKRGRVKWPRTLEPVPLDTPPTSDDLFFAFTYERPMGWGLYVGAALVVLGVLAATLFPLAPYPVRLAVLYLLSGLLCLILGTIVLRYVLWLVVWVSCGRHFWLFPNMMSETVPVTEIFSPAISWTAPAPGDASSSLLLRAAAAAALAGGCWLLWAAGPDAKTVGSNLRGAKDSVLTYFDLMEDMRVGISNGTNTTGITLNNTANGSSSSGGSGTTAEPPSGEEQQEEKDLPADDDDGSGDDATADAAAAAGASAGEAEAGLDPEPEL